MWPNRPRWATSCNKKGGLVISIILLKEETLEFQGRSFRVPSEFHQGFLWFSLELPWKSLKVPSEFRLGSLWVPCEFPQNSLKVPCEFPQNSLRVPLEVFQSSFKVSFLNNWNKLPDSQGSIASKLTSPAPPTMNSSLSPSKSTKGGGGLFDAEK